MHIFYSCTFYTLDRIVKFWFLRPFTSKFHEFNSSIDYHLVFDQVHLIGAVSWNIEMPPKISASVKKLRKQVRDGARYKSMVNVGSHAEKWRELKEVNGFDKDADFAEKLLEM